MTLRELADRLEALDVESVHLQRTSGTWMVYATCRGGVSVTASASTPEHALVALLDGGERVAVAA